MRNVLYVRMPILGKLPSSAVTCRAKLHDVSALGVLCIPVVVSPFLVEAYVTRPSQPEQLQVNPSCSSDRSLVRVAVPASSLKDGQPLRVTSVIVTSHISLRIILQRL